MPTLFVRCPSCAAEMPTRIALQDPEHSGLVVSGLTLRCPSCRVESTFYTKDLYAPIPSSEAAPAVVSARRRGPLPGPIP